VVISAADACLLMSETEGLSNSIIEYMSLGRPVVCTNVGGNVELVTDGQTGFVVSVGDPMATSERLELLLNRADISAQMGENARAFALARCSAEHMLAAHSALYHEMAGVCEPVAGPQR
jgi:glycosyltransferase involved in cell wall biosynthesis